MLQRLVKVTKEATNSENNNGFLKGYNQKEIQLKMKEAWKGEKDSEVDKNRSAKSNFSKIKALTFMIGLKKELSKKRNNHKKMQCIVVKNPKPKGTHSQSRGYFDRFQRRNQFTSYSRSRIKSFNRKQKSINRVMIKELEGGTKMRSFTNLVGIRKKKQEFKQVYKLNLLKHKLLKRFIKSKKDESYLFVLYKGNRDLSLHVSLGEDIEFKGYVYRDKDM